MKMLGKVIVALLVSQAVANAAILMYWGSDGGLDDPFYGDVYYRDGSLVSQGSDWLVELVNTADDSVLISINDAFLDGDGVFYSEQDAESFNGLTVKTVIYDAADKGSAQYFAEFTAQTTFTWGTPAPPSVDYFAGVVTSVTGTQPGEWQAIPEPAVAGLLSIAGIGLLFGRRIFRKD